MAFKFTDSSRYPYEPGGFFLGLDDQGREVGIRSERHLITVAGAGSGKGAALIVPNLQRWPGACVIIDPKGENASVTAQDRFCKGQSVGVVDPYRITKDGADELRCSINPLAVMDPESLTIRADLEALGDGLIRRHDPKHAQWDDTAAAIVAGLADFVLADCPPVERTLLSVRGLLLLPEDDLKAIAAQMIATATSAGLARQAGTLIQNKFSNPEGVPASAFARAVQETGWIDDPAFAAVLGGDALPAFDLSTLKAGTGSLYLCIPPGYLDTRGGFLRLFVRMGLMTMMRDLADHGGKTGRCLFLLDEFHSLGKMEIVAKAAGLMRGYGVQLWPFLQDLGQLAALYGQDEMGTFFGNADAHIFFGNTDADTLGYISQNIGVWTQKEIGAVPPTQSGLNLDPDRRARAFDPIHAPRPMPTMPHRKLGGLFSVVGGISDAIRMSAHQASVNEQARERQAIDLEEKELAREDQNAMRAYQDRMAKKGEPLVTPQEVRELVAKRDGEAVARSMIVFAKGGDKLNIRLAPYFMPPPEKRDVEPDPLPDNVLTAGQIFAQYQAAAKAVSAPVSVWPRIVLAVVGYYAAYFALLLVMPAQSGWIFAFMGALLGWEWQKRRDQQRLAILQKCEREMRKAMATLQTWMDENGPIPRTPATAAWVDSINAHARG
ncbi:type IV secretory system conjugative DNA transfer family protein [Paracoccus fontiphilus]|nr:type IV secretory system conjugative DNA transfer family protein [Paracoccus fontiphilus]